MARSDPTESGGLFVGRPAGPPRYRRPSQGGARQRADKLLAAFILFLEVVLCLSLLGPQPLGWLWVGSQVQYLTGAVTAGISTIMIGCLASLMFTMVARQAPGPLVEARPPRRRLRAGPGRDRDHLRHLRGRHAGGVHLLVPHHPGAGPDAGAHQLVGLLDRYRQFEDVDPEEDRRVRRERRHRERALELEKVPDLDLSGTEWPELPELRDRERLDLHRPRARERLPRPPRRGRPRRPGRPARRRARADRHRQRRGRAAPGRGHGPDRARRRAADPVALLPAVPADGHARGRAPGGRGLARAARARPSATAPAWWCSATPTTRPATTRPPSASPSWPPRCPSALTCVVDEALVQFQDAEPVDAVLRLTDAFPRLLVVRTFSKVYGLSGLRAGYAVGSTASDAAAGRDLARARRQRAEPVRGGPRAEDRRPPRSRAGARRSSASAERLMDGLAALPVDADPARPTSSGCPPTTCRASLWPTRCAGRT